MQQSNILSEMVGAKGRGGGRRGHGIGETMVRAVSLLSEGMGIVCQSEASAKCNNQRRSIGDIGVERLGRNTVTVCVQCAIGERTMNCKHQQYRRAARIDDR